MNSISNRIKHLRESKNLSQKKLAEIAKVSQPTVYNIEHGKTDNVTLTVGKRIAKALGVSFGELFEIEGSGKNVTELKKEVDRLQEENEKLKKENKEIKERYKSQVNDKEQIIQFLKAEKEIYRKNVVNSIMSWYDFKKMDIEDKIKNAKTDREKKYHEKVLESQTMSKDYMIENFIHQGFIRKEHIENYYNELKKHYMGLTEGSLKKNEIS